MGSSVLRYIFLKKAAGILRRNCSCGGGRRMMSTTTTTTNIPSQVSPWLMLSPTFDKRRGGMVYNFYSLADDEVVLLDKYGGGADPIESPDDDALVVGSSHGWLALMNRRNNDLFLSNPLSRRHIKLPPIDALPHPEVNLRRGGRGHVSKVIVSGAPDDGDCRAMMSFGPGDRLAFCRPGHSEAWTPIGELFLEMEGPIYKFGRVYDEFVYSRRRNLFYCLALNEPNYNSDLFFFEDWDLRSSENPRIDWIQKQEVPEMKLNGYEWLDERKAEEMFGHGSRVLKHLAYAEERDELFLLFRYLDGVRTLGFIAAKVVKEDGGNVRLVVCSLEGLALFVGTNHSFVAAAAEFPHLKSNSIYFTDQKRNGSPRFVDNYKGGNGDIGIFDCGDGTFSSCYYPLLDRHSSNFKKITPAPIWFTPTL